MGYGWGSDGDGAGLNGVGTRHDFPYGTFRSCPVPPQTPTLQDAYRRRVMNVGTGRVRVTGTDSVRDCCGSWGGATGVASIGVSGSLFQGLCATPDAAPHSFAHAMTGTRPEHSIDCAQFTFRNVGGDNDVPMWKR